MLDRQRALAAYYVHTKVTARNMSSLARWHLHSSRNAGFVHTNLVTSGGSTTGQGDRDKGALISTFAHDSLSFIIYMYFIVGFVGGPFLGYHSSIC